MDAPIGKYTKMILKRGDKSMISRLMSMKPEIEIIIDGKKIIFKRYLFF